MIKQRSLAVLILLSLVTCGIYAIVFFYQYTEDVNKICHGDGKSSMSYILVCLLSVITCGIYWFYWLYQQANRLYCAAPRYRMNFQEDGGTVLLWYLLGSFIIVGPFIALHILIKNMNAIAPVYNAGRTSYNAMYSPYQK